MSGKLLRAILSGVTPPKIRPQEGVVVIPEGTSLFHGTTKEAAESRICLVQIEDIVLFPIEFMFF